MPSSPIGRYVGGVDCAHYNSRLITSFRWLEIELSWGIELNTDNAQRDGALSTRHRASSALIGSVCAFGLAAALTVALGSAPASARIRLWQKPAPKPKETENVSKEPFGDIPKGPLQIFVSINQQKLHLYSDGVHIADSSVATGVPSLPTPFGVFSVIQKQVFHRSNIYSNAPMPYMQRITWSGVALHEGENIGHPASHGCIRMPHDFAVRLFGVTKIGARVIIARDELKPIEFADPHLFVHTTKPPQIAAAPATAESLRTAQTIDNSKTTDVASADAAVPAKPGDLGLRVSQDGAPGADAVKTDPAATDVPKADGPVAAGANVPAVAVPIQQTASAGPDTIPPVVAKPEDLVPMPLSKPTEVAQAVSINKSPIAIFVSRKEKKIYVRQNFEPLFDAAITIEHPEQPLGTHVFTAMEFMSDNVTLRCTAVSLPGEPPKPALNSVNDKRFEKYAQGRAQARQDSAKPAADLPPPQTPAEALARIDISQNVIDNISQMMVPGSSLVVSDQGLGDETGGGTDFIVVTH
jgi:hypothetical protein